jgi:transcriptional regulator with XRE-family HTH domain
MNLREKIGNRIQKARKEAGMTQHELAAACNFSRGRLSNWEGSTRLPSAQEVHKLATILKVSPAWLFCLTDEVTEYETPQGRLSLIPIVPFKDLHDPKKLDAILHHDHTKLDLLSKYDLLALSPTNNAHLSSFAFSVTMSDASMSPEILEGDFLIIDPALKPEPGKYVLAIINAENKAVIRKYRQPNKDSFELVCFNQDWPHYQSQNTEEQIKLIGVVAELRRSV